MSANVTPVLLYAVPARNFIYEEIKKMFLLQFVQSVYEK